MRQIIILETNPSDGGQISVNCVFWFSVPVGQEVPMAGFVSAWHATASKPGPTAQETTDLQDGKVLEEQHNYVFPSGTSAASVKAQLVSYYNARASYRAGLPNQGQFYGTAYDGSVWV